MNALKVILGPVISEKSMNEASKGRYTFAVFENSKKKEIKKAIEEKFGVNVLKISTIIVKGRKMRTGAKRIEKLQSPFKKAVVTVKKGQKIPIFESGTQK